MNELLKIGARQQITRLNRRELELGFSPNSLRPLPRFFGNPRDINCRDSDLFALHTIINAIREVRRAVNFVVASSHLYDTELYAPCIVTGYTSAFHALSAHLSIEGRSHFDHLIWSSSIDEIETPPVKIVVGILTRNNQWKYEPRRQSHTIRWREIRQLIHRQNYKLPKCFNDLFNYLYSATFRKGVSPIEILKNPEIHRVQMLEVLPDFLEKIAHARHHAMYNSAGEDPRAVEGLWNGDPHAASYLHMQGEAFMSFAHELLRSVLADILDLFDDVKLLKKSRSDLGLCISIPWYDEPQLDKLKPGALKDELLHFEKIFSA